MHGYALQYLEPYLQPNMTGMREIQPTLIRNLQNAHSCPLSLALDIGSGSGYLTACMAEMVAPEGKVVGVEHISELVDISKRNVAKNKNQLLESGRVKFVVADGRLGYAKDGPYDCM
jgi:protein-L-isoaspartate(D-aspartate) O-methyltransferase